MSPRVVSSFGDLRRVVVLVTVVAPTFSWVCGCGGRSSSSQPEEFDPDKVDITKCTSHDDCVLSTLGCCGACEPIAPESFIAVNRAYLADYHDWMCDDGVLCGACPDYAGPPTRPWFGARCDDGSCQVFDARFAATCTLPSDCHFRDGLGCCSGCGDVPADEVVVISSEQALQALVCDRADTACADCDATYPPGAEPDCVSGVCAVDLNLR